MSQNQRKTKRLPLKGKIIVRDENGEFVQSKSAGLRDIGKNGFAFMADEELKRGLKYQFSIDLDGKIINLKGRVIHRRNEGTHFLYGIKITSFPLFHKGYFQRHLAAQFKRFRWGSFAISILLGGLYLWIFNFFIGLHWIWSLLVFLITVLIIFFKPPF